MICFGQNNAKRGSETGMNMTGCDTCKMSNGLKSIANEMYFRSGWVLA